MDNKIKIYQNVMKSIKNNFDLTINKIIFTLNNLEFNKGENKKFNPEEPTYSTKKYENKEIKHHPKRHCLSFDDLIKLRNVNYKSKSVSMSILDKTHDELVQYIIETTERRKNGFMCHYNSMNHPNLIIDTRILNGLDFKDDIQEYKQDEITKKFPEFKDGSGNSMYDIIYSIKTENPHHFILSTNNTYFMSEYILICCVKDKYNILFHSTKGIQITQELFELLYNKIN
jgi:hypothetical protein